MILRFFVSLFLLCFFDEGDAFAPWPGSARPRERVDPTVPGLRAFSPPALRLEQDSRGPQSNVIRSNITLDIEVVLEFEVHSSIASITPETWNSCLPAKDRTCLGSAFLDYSWLYCLEESKCAAPQTGWVPQHVSIKLDGETKGFIPLYIKGNSSK